MGLAGEDTEGGISTSPLFPSQSLPAANAEVAVGSANLIGQSPETFFLSTLGISDLARPGGHVHVPAVGTSDISYDAAGLQMQSPVQGPLVANLSGIESRRQVYDYNFDLTGFSVLNWLPLSFPGTEFPQDDLTSLPFWPSSVLQDTSSQENTNGLEAGSDNDHRNENMNGFPEGANSELPFLNNGNAELESIADTSSNQEVTGEYYVDGNGARRSKTAVRSRERLSDNHVSPTSNGSTSGSGRQANSQFSSSETILSQVIYQRIVICFETLQRTPSSKLFNEPLDKIPDFEALDHLLQLSIQRFLPVVPIVHIGSICDKHWVLILALAFKGLHCIENETNEELKILHDFLIEAVLFVVFYPFRNNWHVLILNRLARMLL